MKSTPERSADVHDISDFDPLEYNDLDVVRIALGMPGASIADLAAEASRLRRVETAAKVVVEQMVGQCSERDPQCDAPSFAGFMHGRCKKHADEYDAPVSALEDQGLVTDLQEALTRS